ncbi:AMP-dependent synthetase and ligase [Candidatus Accumulibacter aalborgensis]|uniref:AMP-dependent synthetase and ligase n=1 Tax=Candidatus Accumulibacter aalborgensis TaxID=1860102 RepID=A0A1A8XRP8_9PROT|nr:AMP-binding protein [Candidatus Accumulibacter aalborgensis]SBT07785.1 AMP-dependent synthetase and ligase [Candidatus Accumulibacter aalborgensis]
MSHVPLLAHASLDEIFAYQPSGPVTVRSFLAAAATLAERLPAGRRFLNLCRDRYRFTVGLAAGLLDGRSSLLPTSQLPATLRQIQRQCPTIFCLCDSPFDGPFDSLDLPRFDFPDLPIVDPEEIDGIPDIPSELVAITVYTSGSTGLPVAHDKSWGSLVRNARAEASRLGLLAGPRHSIVGTVPAQHMFGFESTVLLAMHGNSPFWSGKPFYPQDVADALQAVPPPRMLVTTPFHLGIVLAAEVELPTVNRLLSATAPLSSQLAAAAESRLAAPVDEIYGCTETGQVASRRLLVDPAWLPLDGVCLQREAHAIVASGGHIEVPVALADEIELLPDGRFMLLGRNADVINVAGKRSSLAYLDHQLTAIPGVVDGAFFQPDEASPESITRLCAFAVAPQLSERQLLAQLRQRVDAVFLPRPLWLVDSLPRNRIGKLPRAQMQVLYAAHAAHETHQAMRP